MSDSIDTQLKQLQQEGTTAIASAENLDSLERLRITYFGKKGQLSQILRGMGKLSAEERPIVGNLANEVKETLQNCLDKNKNYKQQRSPLESKQRQSTLPCRE